MDPRTKAEEAVDRALDRFILRDPVLRGLTKKMIKAQRVLHKIASKRAWLAYMTIEELANARDTLVVDAAIRLALKRRARP